MVHRADAHAERHQGEGMAGPSSETEPASANGARIATLLRRTSGTVILAAALIAVGIALSLVVFVMLQQNLRDIDKDRALSIGLERLLSDLKDVETGVRGYALTDQVPFLEPYTSAIGHIDADLQAVDGLGVEIDDLRKAVVARVNAANDALAKYRELGREGLLATRGIGRGKAAMDSVRAIVATLQRHAEARIAAGQSRARWVWWPLGMCAFLLILFAFALIARFAAERRREQQASARLLEDVMDNAPVGLGLVDRSMRVQHVNRALAALASAEARVGADLWDLVPDMRPELAPRIDKVLASRRPTSVDLQVTGATRGERARDLQVVVFPFRTLKDQRDSATGVGVIVSDVSARRRAERRMQDSEIRFRTLTESSAAVIWSAGPGGVFDRPQPRWCAFTGQDEDAAKGAGWLDAVHPDDRPETLERWSAATASHAPYAADHRLRRADGEWRHMAVVAVPILDEEGRVREWVGTHTDITERKQAEADLQAAKEAAEASNRAKSAFLANMSHELRTPLSAVIGYSEMLEEEIGDLGATALLADVGRIQSNARHLLSLINDVLDLSKIEANRMELVVETVDVATLALEVAGAVDALVRQKRNRLELRLGATLGTMRTDAVKLRQCLLNLLGNAAKFTEGGRIAFDVARVGQGVQATLRFQVIDTGIGMSAEQVARLFQRFAQADETTTRRYGGSGLGLALTRAFSRLLGGEVTVESALGEGTTFTLTLPASIGEAGQAPSETALPSGKAGGDSPAADGAASPDRRLSGSGRSASRPCP